MSSIDMIRDIHASGVTIVWIEHIVHALLAVVGRIMEEYLNERSR